VDKYDCYELCVQGGGGRWIVPFLRALHGQQPRVLREDFCGTAAVSRRWAADLRRSGLDGRAVGVDIDAEVLARGRAEASRAGAGDAVELVRGDAVHDPVGPGEGCDVIYVGNFSIGYIHERADLVAYLRRCAQRLRLGAAGFGGGVLVVDVYDGPGKYALGTLHRTHMGYGREVVQYAWEHRDADALTGMVDNAVHFRVIVDGELAADLPDAFTYRWRLWSIPELRGAMAEAGFASSAVYQQVCDRPVALAHGRELAEGGVACVVGGV
jgi:SAM-dependent methyltransferase